MHTQAKILNQIENLLATGMSLETAANTTAVDMQMQAEKFGWDAQTIAMIPVTVGMVVLSAITEVAA